MRKSLGTEVLVLIKDGDAFVINCSELSNDSVDLIESEINAIRDNGDADGMDGMDMLDRAEEILSEKGIFLDYMRIKQVIRM